MDAAPASPRRLSRRGVVRTTAAAGAVLGAGLTRPVTAQDADSASHLIVGAWRILPDPPGPPLALIVYHGDGTLVYSVPASAAAAPGSPSTVVFDTAAYGVWETLGERSVALTASLIESDENGDFIGTLTFHGTVEIDPAQDAYRFAGEVDVADPSGAVMGTFPVSTQATRIRVDRTRAAAATPAAATPSP